METHSEKLKVVVKRSEWGRGTESWRSNDFNPCLFTIDRNDKPLRCCLGFLCNAVGIVDEYIEGVAMPASLRERHPESYLLVEKIHNDGDFGVAADINDNYGISDMERETQLIEWGLDNGVEFTFVD